MHDARDSLIIPPWANGPDGSGNGGWSAGLLAEHLGGAPDAISVSLRLPPPLGRALQVVQLDDGSVQLQDAGETLIATAEPTLIDLDVPTAVCALRPAQAREARAGFAFRDRHPFARCIACGTERAANEPSLHLHCGPVSGCFVPDDRGAATPVFADVWLPSPDLAAADDDGVASMAACWSALDCPSAAPFADPDAERPSVLARITVRLTQPVRIGAEHVAASWLRSTDGRKRHTTSVLLDAHGTVCGIAQALWIEVRAA